MSLDHRTGSATSVTLLDALRDAPQDAEVWGRFLLRYEPLIQRWCRAAGLQEADSCDVAQDVMLRISKAMRAFEYDPSKSFRAWLRTITHRAWADWVRQSMKPDRGHGDTAVLKLLHSVESRDDLSTQLEAMFDVELMDLAILRVRSTVQPRTWSAFKLTAIDGLKGAEVAKQLGMKVAHVYVARSEVKKTLQRELRRIEALTRE